MTVRVPLSSAHTPSLSTLTCRPMRAYALRRGPLANTAFALANTAFTDDGHLERTLRRGLGHIQLRPDLIDFRRVFGSPPARHQDPPTA